MGSIPVFLVIKMLVILKNFKKYFIATSANFFLFLVLNWINLIFIRALEILILFYSNFLSLKSIKIFLPSSIQIYLELLIFIFILFSIFLLYYIYMVFIIFSNYKNEYSYNFFCSTYYSIFFYFYSITLKPLKVFFYTRGFNLRKFYSFKSLIFKPYSLRNLSSNVFFYLKKFLNLVFNKPFTVWKPLNIRLPYYKKIVKK